MYKPIERADQLPPEGPPSAESSESRLLDFKEASKHSPIWERAKDIAGFANGLGGTIIVGATESPVRYVGIEIQGLSFLAVREHYESAAGACWPPVEIDPVPIQIRDVTVVAVNVPPFANGVVASPAGIKLKQPKQNGARQVGI